MGRATVTGKEDLRAYWLAAVTRIETIQFTLDRAMWDAEQRELVIVSIAAINGRRTRACEFMRLDEHGRVIEGEAMYGAER